MSPPPTPTEPNPVPFFIDGQWRFPHADLSAGKTFEVYNPYTDNVVGVAASVSVDVCREAIDAAQAAFLSWEKSDYTVRQNIFIRAADIFASEAFKKRCIEVVSSETASNVDWTTFNWSFCSTLVKACLPMTAELKGEYMPSFTGGHVTIQRRAMGVVLSISPWNAPLPLSVLAVAVPIMCGNTVVLKASELCPRTHTLVAEVFQEAGLPPGVLNVVTVSREDAPHVTSSIIADSRLRLVNFTGSAAVGRLIAIEAAKNLKPCILECGGKAPSVVLNDANVSNAAKAIVVGAFMHSGQVCMSTERVIVQKGVAQQLINEVVQLSKQYIAGDPAIHALPPLFSKQSAQRVRAMLQDAVGRGAKVLIGDIQGHDGSIVQPHILLDVDRSSSLWKEESFAPVLIVATCDTVDQAVELANDSEYSLSASVWTENVHTAFDVSRRIYSGYTNVNGATMHTEPTAMVCGLGGLSGYGRMDVEHFTHKRRVVFHPSTPVSMVKA